MVIKEEKRKMKGWMMQRRKDPVKREEINSPVHSRLLLLGSLFGSLGNLSTLAIRLLDGFDNTDGNGLPHVTHGKASEWCVLVVAFNAHWLGRNKLDNGGITGLDEFRVGFHRLTCSAINLLDKLGELAGNVSGVAIEYGCVAGTDLTRVVEDNDLGVEGSGFLGRVVLGVRAYVSTSDILDGHVLDVETNVVTRVALLELFVVHFDGLDFSGNVGWGEGNDHAGLDNPSFDTTDRDSSNTTDLVHILEGETKGPIGRSCWGFNTINGV